MTARQLYEGVLIELNKENAPNVLLEDFNYFANKAVNNYVNKRYNIYDINQQTTDDLRVLKATALLEPTQVTDKYLGMTMAGYNKMATYEVTMPSDYLHILNCICIYKVNKTYKCYNKDDYWRAPATRLTADMYSLVLDNFWNKPTYKRPYYYIHNVNQYDTVPTNPYSDFDAGSQLSGLDTVNIPGRNTRGGLSTLLSSNNTKIKSGYSLVYNKTDIPEDYVYEYGYKEEIEGDNITRAKVVTYVSYSPTSNFSTTGKYSKTVDKKVIVETEQISTGEITSTEYIVQSGDKNDYLSNKNNVDIIGTTLGHVGGSIIKGGGTILIDNDDEQPSDTDTGISKPIITGSFINGSDTATITINCATSGVTIYYTTDGTNPTVGSEEYVRPFTINKTTTIKAIAGKASDPLSSTIDLFSGIASKVVEKPLPENVDNPESETIILPKNAANPSGTDVEFLDQFKSYYNNKIIEYELDANGRKIVNGTGNPDFINIGTKDNPISISTRERGAGIRYGNVSLVRLEIRYGTDNSVFSLEKVYVDYIKAPQNIRLTQQEIDLTEDTSQMLEYPDYVCQEIINELVHLIMENISDQRLQTHPVVSLSIANPAQALTQQAQGLSA